MQATLSNVQTSAHPPRRRATVTRAKRPAREDAIKCDFKDFPTTDAFFWLHVWMESVAKLDAFQLAIWHDAPHSLRRRNTPEALERALWRCLGLLQDAAAKDLEYVRTDGHLLFAWYGTTVLRGAT